MKRSNEEIEIKKRQKTYENVIKQIIGSGGCERILKELLEGQEDREIVLAALKQNGNALNYVIERYKEDREMVITAVRQNGDALRYADKKLKDDKEIVMNALSGFNQWSISFASNRLKKDIELIEYAVERNGYTLSLFSKEITDTKCVVMKAIGKHGLSIIYASNRLKNDIEVILRAVRNNKEVLNVISDEFKSNREVLLSVDGIFGYFGSKKITQLNNIKFYFK